ncbi:magnesium transporter CorA family protein [Atopococcus tabaci]|uniref:magnesium transporter CorA family protein n=1 Tax=Atopococcus tabaci TaxID=269774 RepID=UPI000426D4C8|nr:magnesium transporter CorA family protein [Atopococcus tabaci]
MIQLYHQEKNGNIRRVEAENGQPVHWVHLLEPEEDEISRLIQRFRLPKDFLTSAFDPDELARFEKLKRSDGREVFLIVLNYPKKLAGEDYQYTTRPLVLILMDDLIITASEEMPSFLKETVSGGKKERFLGDDPIQFALKLVMDIARQYILCLKKIHAATERVERQIIESSKTEYLINMMYLKKSLVYIRTSIDTNHPAIHELETLKGLQKSQARQALLHDVHIETVQAEKMAEQTLLLLEHISDMVSSIINNNVNRVMKLLTSITLLLTIPTLVGGLWGMNVPVPLARNAWGFWLILGLILALALIVYYWLKKRDFF